MPEYNPPLALLLFLTQHYCLHITIAYTSLSLTQHHPPRHVIPFKLDWAGTHHMSYGHKITHRRQRTR